MFNMAAGAADALGGASVLDDAGCAALSAGAVVDPVVAG
jgi:hypothetical protein